MIWLLFDEEVVFAKDFGHSAVHPTTGFKFWTSFQWEDGNEGNDAKTGHGLSTTSHSAGILSGGEAQSVTVTSAGHVASASGAGVRDGDDTPASILERGAEICKADATASEGFEDNV